MCHGLLNTGHLTCSLTLAVSSGKVTRSAMQAAVPAPKNLTAAEGTMSLGVGPTISTTALMTQMENFALKAICP